ncbi:WXG100 family type VII secretion target [Mycobacteroides chelonae]|uniref:WXG100 family type VII secretion target n=1 Tax=Mycobacteroides chelonae TaxID=1774 RepID=UPI000991BEFA
MSGVLRVPPEQMHREAAQLHGIAQDLKDTHGKAHGQISDVLSGFGETESASFLRSRLEQWEDETHSHHQHLTTHADNRSRIANTFVATDDLGATGFTGTVGQGDA